MVDAMRHGMEHIRANTELLQPGANFEDICRNCHVLKPQYQKQKYSCIAHGVGLCDEWPMLAYPDSMVEGAFDHEVRPGMVFCVEALVSPEGGDFSIKLEDQVLVGEDGPEVLSRYPYDAALSGEA